MRKFALNGLILALSLLVAEPSRAADVPQGLRAKAAAALPSLREAFDDALFDYPSARFKDVRALYTSVGNQPYFCGKVNAKNRSGAYIGWQVFAWRPWLNDGLLIESEDEQDAIRIDRVCTTDGNMMDAVDYSGPLTYKPK